MTTLSAFHPHCSKPHRGVITRFACYCSKMETAQNICLRQQTLLQRMDTTMSQYSSSRTLSYTQRVVCHCYGMDHQLNQRRCTVVQNQFLRIPRHLTSHPRSHHNGIWEPPRKCHVVLSILHQATQCLIHH